MTHTRRTKTSSREPKEFLSPTEAAQYLSLGRKTTYHWIHQGYFPHHRMGKLIKIRRSDLDAFLEKTRVSESRPESTALGSYAHDQGRG